MGGAGDIEKGELTLNDLKDMHRLQTRQLGEKNPAGLAGSQYRDRKRAAQNECAKLLPKPWWKTGRDSQNIFTN